eukprot:3299068-Prymnesium_polylepis.1
MEMAGLIKDCKCQKRWRKMTRIGSGAYGSAYHACSVSNSKDCEYVVKVQSNNATAKRELNAYMRLSGNSVVPRALHDYNDASMSTSQLDYS